MITIEAKYTSIEPVRDLCDEWINLWSGDEWGEVMHGLLLGSHVDYGISDEDCAKVATIMIENVIAMGEWTRTPEAQVYMPSPEDDDAEATRQKCREIKEYWLKGGNLGDFGDSKETAKRILDQLPNWVVGEQPAKDN